MLFGAIWVLWLCIKLSEYINNAVFVFVGWNRYIYIYRILIMYKRQLEWWGREHEESHPAQNFHWIFMVASKCQPYLAQRSDTTLLHRESNEEDEGSSKTTRSSLHVPFRRSTKKVETNTDWWFGKGMYCTGMYRAVFTASQEEMGPDPSCSSAVAVRRRVGVETAKPAVRVESGQGAQGKPDALLPIPSRP